MANFKLTVKKILDRDDPESFTFVLNYEDASKILSEEQLRERAYVDRSEKELREKLVQFSDSPVFLDFVKANVDKVGFEVYPAELFVTTKENSKVEISYD